MPTYQYSCTQCGHFFEVFQSFSDDSLTVCPECDGQLRKVFNAVGVVFKGSGFYRNDSRGKQSSSDAPSTTGPESTPAAPAAASAGGSGSASKAAPSTGPSASTGSATTAS